MGSGNASQSVDHGHDNEAEGQGYPDMGDCSAAYVVNNDRPCSGEDEGEGSDKLREISAHHSSIFQQHPPLS